MCCTVIPQFTSQLVPKKGDVNRNNFNRDDVNRRIIDNRAKCPQQFQLRNNGNNSHILNVWNFYCILNRTHFTHWREQFLNLFLIA